MGRSMVQTGPTLTSPIWAGDYGNREHLVPAGAKIDDTQFQSAEAVKVVITGTESIGSTTLEISSALTGPIPVGTLLYFNAAGKFARLTVAAALGAVSLTVEAIPVALAANDTAYYNPTGRKAIQSGTIVGRTLAERDAGTPFGPAVDTDDEIFIVYNEVTDASKVNDIELYRHRSVVKENFLPGWTTVAAALKTKIRTLYLCTRGVD